MSLGPSGLFMPAASQWDASQPLCRQLRKLMQCLGQRVLLLGYCLGTQFKLLYWGNHFNYHICIYPLWYLNLSSLTATQVKTPGSTIQTVVGTPPQTTSGAVILGAMSIRVAPSLGNHGSAPAITSAMRRVPQLHLLVVTAASEPKTADLRHASIFSTYVVENQMEKNMENEMETGGNRDLRNLIPATALGNL